jgi:hypothetical protein
MKEFHCLAFLSLFRHQNSTHKRIFADNEVLIAGLSRFSTPPLYVQPQAMQRPNYPENSQEGAKAKFNWEIQVQNFLILKPMKKHLQFRTSDAGRWKTLGGQ